MTKKKRGAEAGNRELRRRVRCVTLTRARAIAIHLAQPRTETMAIVPGQLLREHPVLSEMVRRLVAAFQPERIYLFGSRARGEATGGSDFDLLVIVSESPLPRYKRDQAAFRALSGVGAAKDVVVFTREEFDRKRTVPSSLPALAEREGIVLYGA